jgi:bifunctional UDP-N-acetylglucosamine pyrophosphorylase/glucosamine-1-phosphate N-acetyltransferase
VTVARPAAVVVLAAGEGTRMRSATPKVLHRLAGRTLLGHALAAARGVHPGHLVVVVRHGRDQVAAHVAECDPDAVVVDQDEVPGTGRALACALEAVPVRTGTVAVTYGDVPLLPAEVLADLVSRREEGGHAVCLLTAQLERPSGYGRIVRGPAGELLGIVEEADATVEQRAIHEVNSGIYAFDADFLRGALPALRGDNAAGEVYLTDLVAAAVGQGRPVAGVPVADPWAVVGVNDRAQLARVGRELNDRIVERWMLAGVSVTDPATTWIDVDVQLAPDVTLLPGVQLHGDTRVASGATIGPDSTLTDVRVGEGSTIVRAHAEQAEIGAATRIGPFSYLRPGTRLEPGSKVGAYVEVKNSQIGEGAKVPHLSYVGDAVIGSGANIGAGTIVANYDGVDKHRTVVGSHSFVGSDSVLVAPVHVGDGAYVAAGSTIVSDVDAGQLAVARARQRGIDGWVARRRPGTAAARAAGSAGQSGGSVGGGPGAEAHEPAGSPQPGAETRRGAEE